MKSKCNFEISWSFFNVFFVFSSSNSCSNNLILSFFINLLPTLLFSLIDFIKDLKEDYKKNLAENQSILGQFMKNNKPNPLESLLNQ